MLRFAEFSERRRVDCLTEDECDLVATEARRITDFLMPAQPPRKDTKDFVPDSMAVPVFELLETIKVVKGSGKWQALQDVEVDPTVKGPPVQVFGQLIGINQPLDLAFGFLAFSELPPGTGQHVCMQRIHRTDYVHPAHRPGIAPCIIDNDPPIPQDGLIIVKLAERPDTFSHTFMTMKPGGMSASQGFFWRKEKPKGEARRFRKTDADA